MKRIYLDYHASTPLDPLIIDNYIKIIGLNGNPHSSHLDGYDASTIIDESRTFVCELFDVFEDEIIFTSGATESNNLAIAGSLEKFHSIDPSRNKVFVSMLEHKSVLEPIYEECRRLGLELIVAPILQEGFIDLDFMKKNLDERTLMVSVCAVNSEIGTIQPIKEIGELCSKIGSLFHVDATQAFYEELKPAQLGISLMSMSSHKLYGPMGVGLLYVDSNLPFALKPLFYGGGQQNGLRPGTIPTHQVYGFVEALKLIAKNPDEKSTILTNRDYLLDMLRQQIPNLHVNGSLRLRHPGNLSIRIEGIDGRTLVNNVKKELSISTGSACSSGTIKPSSVLKAMGLSNEEANATIRISVGRFTSIDDVENAAMVLKTQIDRIRTNVSKT
jgi:cysteine desulfurase